MLVIARRRSSRHGDSLDVGMMEGGGREAKAADREGLRGARWIRRPASGKTEGLP